MEQTTNDLEEIVSRLAHAPATLRSLVSDLSTDALAYREAEGTWTATEVLYHLIDGEIHDWIPRVRIIMSNGPDKRFTPFDREGGLKRYGSWPAAAALTEFERRRGESLAALAAFRLQAADLNRQGIHPEFGSVTLEQLLMCWVTHDLAHVAQIARVLVRHFGKRIGPWTKYFSLLSDRQR